MVDAICKELVLKKDRLNASIGSIYFGGGTPSVLSLSHLQQIFDVLSANFSIESNAEITLEANPDDLDQHKIAALRQLPVNRFSIGIQSFFNEDLLWMNRAHNAGEAESCIKRSQDAGFENLSIDLIYGYPLLSDEKWEANIRKALDFQTPHISSYALTVEDRTALSHAIENGKQKGMNEEQSASQFQFLSERLTQAGFDHYEISNFSLPGKYAVHNTNYWRGLPYLGIGPAAHGFDGQNRYLNVASNIKYLEALSMDRLPETIEELSLTDRYNEYIMTSLRTMWGTQLKQVEQQFGASLQQQLLKDSHPFVKKGQLILIDNALYLSQEGKLFADGIAASLFAEQPRQF